MDDHRFDLLTRHLGRRSRRDILRTSLAALVPILWIGARPPQAAAACLRPGARCRSSSQCCSGQCRKKGRKHRKKCAPLPDLAFGCTTDDASCPNGQEGTPCPNLTNGRCRITHKGRPVCAVRSENLCETCNDNADCIATQGAGAICIRCESCQSGTSCICPFLP